MNGVSLPLMPVAIQDPEFLVLGSVRISLEREEVTTVHSDERAVLRPQAERLLLVLARQPGQLVTKSELMEAVWPSSVVTDDSIVQAVRDIRRLLEDDDQQIIRTVRGQGYRLVPPETQLTMAKNDTEERVVIDVFRNLLCLNISRNCRWQLAVPLTLFLGFIVSIWLFLNINRDTSEGFRHGPGLAVFPFKSPGNNYLGEWIAEDLSRLLARNKNLWVISHHSSFTLRDKAMSASQLSSKLGVRYLVDGRVTRDDESLQLEVRLTDLALDRIVWSQVYATDKSGVYALQRSAMDGIAGQLASVARQATRQYAFESREPASLNVYELTQRALALKHLFSRQATERARGLLGKVIKLDADYAPAWAALCWVNALDGLFSLTGKWTETDAPKAISQCQQAIEISPFEPLTFIALADAFLLDGRLDKAAQSAERAVQLAPGDAEALLLFGFHQLPISSAQPALDAVKRANRLFPVKPAFVHLITAQVAWAAGDSELALSSARSCLLNAPHFAVCNAILSLVASQSNQTDVADAERAVFLEKSSTANIMSIDAVCNRFAGEPGRQEYCRDSLSVSGNRQGN
ncbi:MAG: winged helix-turn-helix domain-containing protein [Granulosicoccus sp.]